MTCPPYFENEELKIKTQGETVHFNKLCYARKQYAEQVLSPL